MTAKRRNLSTPEWIHDELASLLPPEIEDAYFDEQLRAWVLSRPAGVLAAFHDPTVALGVALAVTVTGANPAHAERFRELACPVPASAAEPYDASLRAQAKAAEAKRQPYFPAGPLALRDSGFVALSQTLPCLLANSRFALPRQLGDAGRARILFRMATADLTLSGLQIRAGERIIVRLFAANHDPDRCGAHLTLGAGPHSCVGASLIRTACLATTQPLIERFKSAELIEPVEWQGGSGFRAPKSLNVWLHAAL